MSIIDKKDALQIGLPEKRKLLYFDASPNSDDRFPADIYNQWEIFCARDFNSVLELVNAHQFRVGLVSIDARNKEFSDQFANLFSTIDTIQWIALLLPQAIESKAVRQYISEHFYDYHTLPVDPERLLITLGRVFGMTELAQIAQEESSTDLDEFEIVGGSSQLRKLASEISKVAAVDAPVILFGETGTGKELVARAIHQSSKRADAPFVAVNCAALPNSLIQSELFGHEKGSFTGADKRKLGRIETAAGGTLMLDEIGDLSIEVQATLLRFLQEKTFERIGSCRSIHADVRIIAATHVNLENAMAQGRFREDLYYRLNVLSLRTPSLRKRKDDIEMLARFFFEKFSRDKRPRLRGFSSDALQVMKSYDWPGNVRELMNRVRQAMVMAEGTLIKPENLGLEKRMLDRHLTTLENARSNAEKQAILSTLFYSHNNITKAAQLLGISRATLYRLMEKYDLSCLPADSD